MRTADLAAMLLTALGAALLFWPATTPALDAASCSDRVVLRGGGATSWGSITRSGIGPLSARHVFEPGREVAIGPKLDAVRRLDATDFAFLDGSDPAADPASVPALAGRVVLEGFPARATRHERVAGDVYAPDTVPPGVWVVLDHPEPLVGGFSGGCVRDERGTAIAVIMGASSMRLNGEIRHFARVIPIRDALREAQGHQWSPSPPALLGKPLPKLEDWN